MLQEEYESEEVVSKSTKDTSNNSKEVKPKEDEVGKGNSPTLWINGSQQERTRISPTNNRGSLHLDMINKIDKCKDKMSSS